jgi:hypothetical protein
VISQTFSGKLKKWRPELRHKERASILGVELDTFRGWLYGKHTPNRFVLEAIEKKIAEHEAQTSQS